MKKICFAFNHFQYSDGIARSAAAMANALVERENIEITLRPIFKLQKEALAILDKRVKVKPVLGFYFNGLSKLLRVIPDELLHDLIFGKSRYDIEIGFQHGVSTRAVVSTKNKANHIVWMHGYDIGLLMEDYYKKADQIVCVSKFNADRLKNELNYNVPIDYCYNPIDERLVIEKGNEPIDVRSSSRVTFVTVGRLSEEKGYSRLITVVKRLKTHNYDLTLWIVGDGPEKNTLQKQVDELGLNDNVKFMGNQKNPHKFTSKADVFICSSLSEGYSTACTEAIMLGIPVISTDVSGAEEIIDDASCGCVVDNSADGLYYGMRHVLESPNIINEWKSVLVTTKQKFYAKTRIAKLFSLLSL
ncbi:glycosyltransferase [Streptococcus porci]|uniref:glycosyltransferase n=1 Tax=Streptococcus porci TaxID=502567 RepID=UPI000405BE72|nr:glycosyltransferase [Streptococcus porci]